MDIRTPVPTIYGDWIKLYGDAWTAQIGELKARFGEAIEEVRTPQQYPTDVPIVYVKKESIIAVLTFLKHDVDYDFLADITATDEEAEPRFEIVYNLASTTKQFRIRLKVRLREGEECPTAVDLWPGANWAEREVYDMFGVKFTGHPDLRRILLDNRWVGHPLRKDYPIKGYQIFTSPMQVEESLLEDDK